MKHKTSFRKPFLRLILISTGFLLLCISACKKPDKGGGGNDDNVQPMYGVRVTTFK